MTRTIKASIFSITTSLTLSITSSVFADDDAAKKTYEHACSACHANGLAGAPKLGDIEIWTDRLDSGKEPLYISAINGRGAMPAKGGQLAIPDDAIKAAVDYMISNSQ